MNNIVLITVDSLRYDTARCAKMPYLQTLMDKYQKTGRGWVAVGAHATYTLPAHISMFHAGILPCLSTGTVRPIPVYDRHFLSLFGADVSWRGSRRPVLYPTPDADNVVKGFAKLGYRTVGVGGVHWFDNRFGASSNIWKQYFEEFYWDCSFAEENPSGLEAQLDFMERLHLTSKLPLFFFMNVSSTHKPYRGNEWSVSGQARCLEYVDSHLERLIGLLPKPMHLVLLGDHGECFGEDGLWGHAFYHPKVMQVPMLSLELEMDILTL